MALFKSCHCCHHRWNTLQSWLKVEGIIAVCSEVLGEDVWRAVWAKVMKGKTWMRTTAEHYTLLCVYAGTGNITLAV